MNVIPTQPQDVNNIALNPGQFHEYFSRRPSDWREGTSISSALLFSSTTVVELPFAKINKSEV